MQFENSSKLAFSSRWSEPLSVFRLITLLFCHSPNLSCYFFFHSLKDTGDQFGEIQEDGDVEEEEEGEEAAFDATLHANVSNVNHDCCTLVVMFLTPSFIG